MPEFAPFEEGMPLPATVCLSSFLVSEDAEGLLVGRMKSAKEWSLLDGVESIEKIIETGRWVLPASHLQIGETPSAAATRIAKEQLEASSFDLRASAVFSHSRPVPSLSRTLHWDLCFVFEGDIDLPRTPAWFAELKRLPLRFIHHDLFARDHGDIVADMGFLTPAVRG